MRNDDSILESWPAIGIMLVAALSILWLSAQGLL